jgi:predicted RNA-binding Zn-ribbon protein involved in translation (DUF1610 family)
LANREREDIITPKQPGHENIMTTEFAAENFLDFKCPHCGEVNSFPQDCIGLVRECVNCMDNLIVPEAGGELGKKIPCLSPRPGWFCDGLSRATGMIC